MACPWVTPVVDARLEIDVLPVAMLPVVLVVPVAIVEKSGCQRAERPVG